MLEFGLRRAQGINGGMMASRAAFIGGCAATSNVAAGQRYQIPVKGTHAHSWVMAFDDEPEAFAAYAQAMPNNCLLLVDTFNTIRGVERAIVVAERIRQAGHRFLGVRLDSGDLAELSREARKRLDEAGFEQAAIVASNDLDEFEIERLKQAGAKINVWGVGTKLATCFDQPALGGVYKLSAIRRGGNDRPWSFAIKMSEQAIKVSNPGLTQVRRFWLDGTPQADVLYDTTTSHDTISEWVPLDSSQQQQIPQHTESHDLLQPVMQHGELIDQTPTYSTAQIRNRTLLNLQKLPTQFQRFSDSETYPVGLHPELFELKQSLITNTASNRIKALVGFGPLSSNLLKLVLVKQRKNHGQTP